MGHLLLQAKAITKTFHQQSGCLPVLKAIDFDMGQKEFVGIVGPSGCGKTTFLRILSGIEMPDSGTIIWNPGEGNKPAKISFAFQNLALFPWRTVEGNVRFPLESAELRSSYAEVAATIQALGLGGFEKYYPAQLSGGMRQRLALARALITEPELLILDEPFGALDVYARLRLQDVILRSCETRGISVLMVSHDLHEVVRLCERIIVLTERPAQIAGVVETNHWTRSERIDITATQTAPYVEELHALLRGRN